MLQKMRRRGRPAKMRVSTELSSPVEEHMDESVNVPIPPPEPTVSTERARKLGAINFDEIGDSKKTWSWREGNERVFSVMGCSNE